jgi:hypothetical protein
VGTGGMREGGRGGDVVDRGMLGGVRGRGEEHWGQECEGGK